jgi:hypothetical protein
MTDDARETFVRNNRWIRNVDTAFLFRRLDDARHTGSDPQFGQLYMMIEEARMDERRKAATVARCRVPPEMADYVEQQVLTGGAG